MKCWLTFASQSSQSSQAESSWVDLVAWYRGAPGWPAAQAAPSCGASRGGYAAASEIYVAAFVMAKSKQALGVTLSVWAWQGVRIIR